MKLHREIRHNEKVCHAHKLGSHFQGQGQNQGSSSCNYLKPTEANFVKLYTKVYHMVLQNKTDGCYI